MESASKIKKLPTIRDVPQMWEAYAIALLSTIQIFLIFLYASVAILAIDSKEPNVCPILLAPNAHQVPAGWVVFNKEHVSA